MQLRREELKMLDRIDGELCTAEPRLATKFRIFARLAVGDGPPPEEDLVCWKRPAGPGANPRGHARDWVIFVVLVVLLAVILILSLTGFQP